MYNIANNAHPNPLKGGKCQNGVEPGRQMYWKGGTRVCVFEFISKCLENIDNVSFNIDKTVFSRLPVNSNYMN